MSRKNWGADAPYKGEAAPPEIPKRTPGRKNTRRWCRGKVGREHTVEVEKVVLYGVQRDCGPAPSWWRSGWWCHHWFVCTTCGKRLEKLEDRLCPTST